MVKQWSRTGTGTDHNFIWEVGRTICVKPKVWCCKINLDAAVTESIRSHDPLRLSVRLSAPRLPRNEGRTVTLIPKRMPGGHPATEVQTLATSQVYTQPQSPPVARVVILARAHALEALSVRPTSPLGQAAHLVRVVQAPVLPMISVFGSRRYATYFLGLEISLLRL
jgi:hypothetical protein